MFGVGQPNDAGESVRGAVLVQQVEALQAQYLEPPSGEMVERGAPHPAETHDDDVVGDQKLTLTILPSVPTSHPADGLAKATAQKSVVLGSRSQLWASSFDQAAPPGPVATTVRGREPWT